MGRERTVTYGWLADLTWQPARGRSVCGGHVDKGVRCRHLPVPELSGYRQPPMHSGDVVRLCMTVSSDHIEKRGSSPQIAYRHPAWARVGEWITTNQEANDHLPHKFVTVICRSTKRRKLLDD